jgi:type I restriction enzyme S subunit
MKAFAAVLIARSVRADWPIVKLSDVTAHQGYGSSAKATGDPDGVPVLRMGNIDRGQIVTESLKFLPRYHADAAKFRLASGDLLFNRTNSPELVGKTAVYKCEPPEALFASYLIRVRLTDECLPAWAALVLNSSLGREYIGRVRTQQVGQANVNGTKLAAMPVPLPPLEEQRRIVAEIEQQLSQIDALRAAVKSAQRRSASLRRAILERAFRGELVPQDPHDEPASVLVERIRAERAAAPPRPSRSRATMKTS